MTVQTDTTTLPTAEEIAASLDWRGRSGEVVPGADAAHHLEAVRSLLDKRGWSRTVGSGSDEEETEDGTHPLAGADESWTVKRLLLGLIRAVVEEMSWTPAPPTLNGALDAVSRTADGDADTETVAGRCIEAVLRLRTGARYPSLIAWSGKRGRTYEEICEVLTEAAAFARTHGPAVA
ncbi:hypothetical protein CUT44_14345 [Streptomyces carminius]|uniref:Uncharacterized protein n=1 Tax=Streptomyces carminius TaxID=2665496 RepID=A0A2M8LYV1_9ACTN|nr:hypothetical protein [Streptomyces carminius]PJE97156.1 hypothetical protein CUT44_14345 [Streptomyces carminius]